MIKDKVAIITGASSGIGFATALALSKAGAKVAIGARRINKLVELENKIKENGGEVYLQKLDVTKRNECTSFVDNVLKKWGSVDILVNNAGLMPLSFVKSLKVDEWDQMIDINIKGVLYCTAAVISHMLEKKSGHVVNISSVAGRIVFPAGSVYCVTCIEPGVVATELTNTITDESLQGFVENTKKMEALQAEDIANAVVYAVESPNHVNVNEILIRPTTQDR
jgi:NADP-dependent 3-hydroxy acid dehydrogenase YdfG